MEKAEFTVFSSDGCIWCDRAKELLAANGRTFEVINVREDKNSLAWFKEEGFVTVPQVYHGGKWVGGFERLKGYLDVASKV